MAAIDKMYLKDYYVFDAFRLWCLIHNPKLLRHFYHWNLTYKEWEQQKENYYNTFKERNDERMQYASTIESLQEYYKKQDYDAPYKQLMSEVIDTLRQNEALKDKKQFIEDAILAVAHLSPKEDKYLLWHCPIEEVREYLTNQCEYKERWYYKLFFKY